jgi:hypothetical protein
MSWLSKWLNPSKGYEKGQEQLDKYYQEGQGFLNPYNQQGQDQSKNLQEYIKNLMNPQGLQDQWAKNYKESDAAKNMESMAQEHGLNAASGLGLMGSSPALQAIQAGTSGIAAQDRQNYLNDLMKKYEMGAGLSQNIYGQGANAAGSMANNANNMGQNSAQMAVGQQNANGNLFGNLLGMGAGLLGSGLSNYMAWTPKGGK